MSLSVSRFLIQFEKVREDAGVLQCVFVPYFLTGRLKYLLRMAAFYWRIVGAGPERILTRATVFQCNLEVELEFFRKFWAESLDIGNLINFRVDYALQRAESS